MSPNKYTKIHKMVCPLHKTPRRQKRFQQAAKGGINRDEYRRFSGKRKTAE